MSYRTFALILALTAVAAGCSKKAPQKPAHTEPWLAHPSASAETANLPDAASATIKYTLGEQSRIFLELGTRRGKVRGKLTRVSGELELSLRALGRSRAVVHADLSSLTADESDDENAATWLARAKSALGVADAGTTPAESTFELTGLTELSTEAVTSSEVNRVRGVADGNFTLNGFRVQKRLPLEAELGFSSNSAEPATVVIRSRTPFVLTLETHEIHLREPPSHVTGSEKRRGRAQSPSHDVRVTIELHATKS